MIDVAACRLRQAEQELPCATTQAAIPRAELVGTLANAGLLSSVLASYTQNVQVGG